MSRATTCPPGAGPLEREVWDDMATPYWLTDLLHSSARRDPVDVLHAAIVFVRIARERCQGRLRADQGDEHY